jgi:NTE family protein
MAAIGAAKIVGVHISRDLNQEFKLEEIPSNWNLMSDKLTGTRRKYRVPSLMQILMNTTTLYSASREHAAEAMTDLNIKLNLRSVGLLDWHKFDYAVKVGYKRAHKQLSAMTPEQLAPFKTS